jgi:ribosomal-protein-alanine N-acetyltransferase
MANEDGYAFARVTDAADIDAVAALEAESFTNPWTREQLEREVRQSDVARVYVLRAADGALVAFCACWIIFDELHINTIAVTPALRRRGIAKRLMAEVFAAARAEGARGATLEVRESNEPARRLYEQLGFSVEAVRPNYYSHPVENALILWRRRIDGHEP